jgi:hypothetical protein
MSNGCCTTACYNYPYVRATGILFWQDCSVCIEFYWSKAVSVTGYELIKFCHNCFVLDFNMEKGYEIWNMEC